MPLRQRAEIQEMLRAHWGIVMSGKLQYLFVILEELYFTCVNEHAEAACVGNRFTSCEVNGCSGDHDAVVVKLIEVIVSGASSVAEARLAARTVVSSPLVKAAIYGGDPNWGRIMAAVGRSAAHDTSLCDGGLAELQR